MLRTHTLNGQLKFIKNKKNFNRRGDSKTKQNGLIEKRLSYIIYIHKCLLGQGRHHYIGGVCFKINICLAQLVVCALLLEGHLCKFNRFEMTTVPISYLNISNLPAILTTQKFISHSLGQYSSIINNNSLSFDIGQVLEVSASPRYMPLHYNYVITTI